MRRIAILTQSHLARNPRVFKEANALDQAGYSVSIFTVFSEAAVLPEDRDLISANIAYQALVDITQAPLSRRIWNKATFKLGRMCVQYFGVQTPWALGYGYPRYRRKALSIDADLFVVHQEMALQIGVLLLQRGRKVVVDLEDWYSEDLLPEARTERPIQLLKKLEQHALKHAVLCYTTSKAMAKVLARAYQAPEPHVLYNAFPADWQQEPAAFVDRKDATRISLYWYSQTIGPGRGLEALAAALCEIPAQPIALHLRGNVSEEYQQDLVAQFPKWLQPYIHFHRPVNNTELPKRIAEHDIGLALEHSAPKNKDLTISNKMFQYLQSGMLVLATPTQGQREIAETYPNNFVLVNPEGYLKQALVEAIATAPSHQKRVNQPQFCYEEHAEKLVQWFKALEVSN